LKPAATVLRVVERALYALGLVCLGAVAGAQLQSWRFNARESARLAALLDEREASVLHAAAARAEAQPGRAFGRIEFPDQGYSTLLAEGIDASTLRLAVGHLPGSAFPGERGNVALAGHRDSFFHVLKNVAHDERLLLRTPDGVFTYRIVWRSVLEPSRVDVLASAAEPALTLVTCYPFGYIGPAPLRYVVRARLVRPPKDAAANPL
jgi:sortase A